MGKQIKKIKREKILRQSQLFRRFVSGMEVFAFWEIGIFLLTLCRQEKSSRSLESSSLPYSIFTKSFVPVALKAACLFKHFHSTETNQALN